MITASFGLTREEALDFREGAEGGPMSRPRIFAAVAERRERSTAMLRRVIEDRRADPQDDVITLLVESEIEEDGERQLLTDDEIYGSPGSSSPPARGPRGASSGISSWPSCGSRRCSTR